MPVNGLPPVLEYLINKLLDDSKLASYKIVGLEQRTTIVLRFGSPDMSVSAVHHSTPSASFRRKPPSQMRRDEIRKQHYFLRPQHLREARGQNNTIGYALEKSTNMTMDNTEPVADIDETDNVEVTDVQHTTTAWPSDKTNQRPEDNIDIPACKHTCPTSTHNTHDRNNDHCQYFTKEVITDDDRTDCGGGEDSMDSSDQHTTTTKKTYERRVDTADRPTNTHIYCSTTPTTHNTSPNDRNNGVHKPHSITRKTIDDVRSTNQDHEDKDKDQNEGHFQDRPSDGRSSDEEDDDGDYSDEPPEPTAGTMESTERIRCINRKIAEINKRLSQ